MDAIQLIQRDHRELERLFEAFERAGGNARRQGALARNIVRALSIHAAIEEQLVYPPLRERGADDRVLDALEEHHAAKLTLREIDGLPPGHERYAAKVRVLAEGVRRHVAEEERELLPRLKRALDPEQLRSLGDALAEAKQAAPTHPHPAAPDTPPGIFLASPLAALYDRVLDGMRDALALLAGAATRSARRGIDSTRAAIASAERTGREMVDGVADRGRAAARRAERRGQEAAREVKRSGRKAAGRAGKTGRAVARKVQRGVRAATGAREEPPRPTVH
jgi:hemerythrin superfamily protein